MAIVRPASFEFVDDEANNEVDERRWIYAQSYEMTSVYFTLVNHKMLGIFL